MAAESQAHLGVFGLFYLVSCSRTAAINLCGLAFLVLFPSRPVTAGTFPAVRVLVRWPAEALGLCAGASRK